MCDRVWSRPLHDAVEPDAETPELLHTGLNEARLCVESGIRDILRVVGNASAGT